MQRVARINALDQQKFSQTAGKSVGDYLVERGIYGNDEQIMMQLANRNQQSKNLADTELAKLGGQWKSAPIKTALDDLLARETRISSPGASSKDLSLVQQLKTKHDTTGLTMSEVNTVKRLYERNVRLDYLKQNLPESIARANTIDDAIRKWQFSQAEKLGLNNLPEINKETQLAKMLGDALFKKNARSGGNNAFGLADAILLSGGDPSAISMLIIKKTLGNKSVQSSVAKLLAGEPTVGASAASTRAPITDTSRLLPPASGADTTINQGRPIPVAPPGRSILLPKTNVQVGGDAAIPAKATPVTPQSGTKPQVPVQSLQSPKTNKDINTILPQSQNNASNALFGGAVGGVQQDDDGSVSFNPLGALVGLGLGRFGKLPKIKSTPATRRALTEQLAAIERKIAQTSDKTIAKQYAKARDALKLQLRNLK